MGDGKNFCGLFEDGIFLLGLLFGHFQNNGDAFVGNFPSSLFGGSGGGGDRRGVEDSLVFCAVLQFDRNSLTNQNGHHPNHPLLHTQSREVSSNDRVRRVLLKTIIFKGGVGMVRGVIEGVVVRSSGVGPLVEIVPSSLTSSSLSSWAVLIRSHSVLASHSSSPGTSASGGALHQACCCWLVVSFWWFRFSEKAVLEQGKLNGGISAPSVLLRGIVEVLKNVLGRFNVKTSIDVFVFFFFFFLLCGVFCDPCVGGLEEKDFFVNPKQKQNAGGFGCNG